MTVKLFSIIFVSLFVLLLSACAVGPDYVRPCAIVPDRYKEAKGKQVINKKNKYWKTSNPQDTIDRGFWWEIFHDVRLNKLEAELNINNQTIATAVANYYQAWALVDETAASFFPIFTGTFSLTRQKQGSGATSFVSSSTTGGVQTGTATTGAGGTGISHISNNVSLFFNASWEPDLWGSVRRAVEAGVAGAQASQALMASTRLSAQASLAQFYFQLRALDTDQKILDDTVVAYKKAVVLTRNRYVAGVSAKADLIQAETQLQTAESLAINNRINRAVFEHAIAVLIGLPPAMFSIPFSPLHAEPPLVPIEVPSCLLERRPDVAQAERLMAQANAQIGVAVSAYFPTVTLSGTASWASHAGFSKLFSASGFGWSLGTQIAETFLDGGLRAATIRAAGYAYQSTVASYRQIVLTAFQNVEDSLATLRILNKQQIVQNAAAKSAVQALQILLNEYKAGTVAYTDVITAQTTAYTAQKSAADIVGLRMTATVSLIKALGGGWDTCQINCTNVYS